MKLIDTPITDIESKAKYSKALVEFWKKNIVNVLENVDFYIDNPVIQPKQEIADYVESQWFQVAKRFNSLEEAIASWKEFLIRSEHPVEYYWGSWLFESFFISDKSIQERNVHDTKENFEKIIKNDINWYSERKRLEKCILSKVKELPQDDFEKHLKSLLGYSWECYTEILWIDDKEFNNLLTFSYREKLDWYNRSIVEDTAIEWRYHIFTSSTELDDWFYHNYIVYDNWKILLNSPNKLTQELTNEIEWVIDWYKSIKSLPRFNSTHCPIIEFQTVNNENHFLQYHRTQDKSESDFALDRGLEEWEIEVDFVRWATPKEWLILDTKLFYDPKNMELDEEEASFDFHYNFEFTDIMSRKRKAQIIAVYELDFMIMKTFRQHVPKTKLFNSQLSVCIEENKIHNYIKDIAEWDDKKDTVPIKITSDWRKAYIKFM